jgi:transcriptional regulator with XRE-family HTH domain
LKKKTSIREVLASNLRENRRKLGLTQEKLAEMAEVSVHYISMIETCNKYPKPETLEHLAKILGIESYKLFRVEDDPNEPLEKLRQSIVTDMKTIVKEAVDEIKGKNCNNLKIKTKNKK